MQTRRNVEPTVNDVKLLSVKVLRRLVYRAPRYLFSQIFETFP
jgi:hypothetical protein